MPYYVYRLHRDSRDFVKDLDLLDQFESYKDAKELARNKRIELEVKQPRDIKIMFADTQDYAEKKLMEHRDAPILREWEK